MNVTYEFELKNNITELRKIGKNDQEMTYEITYRDTRAISPDIMHINKVV